METAGSSEKTQPFNRATQCHMPQDPQTYCCQYFNTDMSIISWPNLGHKIQMQINLSNVCGSSTTPQLMISILVTTFHVLQPTISHSLNRIKHFHHKFASMKLIPTVTHPIFVSNAVML
jgi:hypothetical protein